MEDENQPKNNDLKILVLLLFILVALGALIWFFGWHVNQGEIIKQNEPRVIYTNVSQ
ncbi:MAG: hypothetical protein WC459_03890 [Patescibacteria group bacterium]